MYFVEPFEVPALDDNEVARALEVALDADRDEALRIAEFHRLRGASRKRSVAVALIPVLNEPRHFLGSEAHLCIRALAPDLLVGRRADRFLVSPSTLRDVERDGPRLVCPTLGPVATLDEMIDLPGVTNLPWLAVGPGTFTVDVNGHRIVRGLHGGEPLMIGAAGSDRVRVYARAADLIIERDITVDAPLRVNGEALDAVRSRVRATEGSVIELGSTVIHIVRLRPAWSRLEPLALHVNPLGRISRGEARPILGGHVVVLGARELGLVHPAAVCRFGWGNAGVAARVGSVGDLEVTVAVNGTVTIRSPGA